MNDNQIDNSDLDCDPEGRESDRFKAIHYDRLPLGKLSPELGTPDEWLGTAISHIKVQESEAYRTGATSITVSEATLALLVWDWEARAVNGIPWKGNVQ